MRKRRRGSEAAGRDLADTVSRVGDDKRSNLIKNYYVRLSFQIKHLKSPEEFNSWLVRRMINQLTVSNTVQ